MKTTLKNLFTVSSVLILLTGCGKFGEKPDKALAFNLGGATDAGCLNDLGPKVEDYLMGKLSQKELSATWQCVEDGLGMFRKFIRGSADEGHSYTQRDVRSLISNFFITDREIPVTLIQSAFGLKASLFGGSTEKLTAAEFDRVIDLLKVAREQTARLLPEIAHYRTSKDYPGLLRYADLLQDAAVKFQDALKIEGNLSFRAEDAKTLLADLGTLFGWSISPEIVDFALAAKVILLGGSIDEFEPKAWKRFIRLSGTIGGVGIGFFSVKLFPENGTGPAIHYFLSLGKKMRDALHESIDYHNGAIPLTDFDRLVDTMPQSFLSLDRVALKEALRPLFNKVFKSLLFDRFDHHAVDTIWNLAETLGRDQAYLEDLFEQTKSGPDGFTRQEFIPAMERYIETLPVEKREEASRWITLVNTYKPMYWRNETRVYFGDLQTYSQFNLSILGLVDRVEDHILHAYSAGTDRLTEAQFVQIIEDFRPILASLRVLKKSDVRWGNRRFLEGNLFMPSSTGDMLFEKSEIVYFTMNIMSFVTLMPTVFGETSVGCVLDEDKEDDRPRVHRDCYETALTKNFENYLGHFPYVLELYKSLNDTQRLEFTKAIVAAGKQSTDSDEVLTWLDCYSGLGFLHFVEGIFQRVDLNKDDVVDVAELEAIFPVYRDLLYNMSKSMKSPFTSDRVLLAILTYVIRFGITPKVSVGGLSHFMLWVVSKKIWVIQSDRLTVFKAFGAMAKML